MTSYHIGPGIAAIPSSSTPPAGPTSADAAGTGRATAASTRSTSPSIEPGDSSSGRWRARGAFQKDRHIVIRSKRWFLAWCGLAGLSQFLMYISDERHWPDFIAHMVF